MFARIKYGNKFMTEGCDWRNQGLETPRSRVISLNCKYIDTVNYYFRLLLLTLVQNSEMNKVASCRCCLLPSDPSSCSELFQFCLLWPLEGFCETECRKKSLFLPSLWISLGQHVSPSLPDLSISPIHCENTQISQYKQMALCLA